MSYLQLGSGQNRHFLLTSESSGLISADNFKMRIFGTLNPSASISGLVVAIYEIGAFVGSIGCMFYGESGSCLASVNVTKTT